MEKTPLRRYREELKVVQDDMANTAGVRPNTYRRAERGGNVSYSTANSILIALNLFRSNRHLEPLTLDDLKLHIV
jgi:DNA-binding XRE family transcriptional regulator